MNTSKNRKRLDELSREIAVLDSMVVDSERKSLELVGSESEQDHASAHVTETKALLDRALRAYYIESEFVRRAEQAPPRAA